MDQWIVCCTKGQTRDQACTKPYGQIKGGPLINSFTRRNVQPYVMELYQPDLEYPVQIKSGFMSKVLP